MNVSTRDARGVTRSEPAGGGAGRLGYLLKCFPRLSETFILNEVLELERQGTDLAVYSLNEPGDPVTHPAFAQVRSRINYLPFPLTRSAHRYVVAHARLLLRSPLRYLATLFSVVAAFDRDLFERFTQAGYLAGLLRRDGVRHVHAGFVHYPGSVAWLAHRLTGVSFSLATHAKDMYHSRPELLRRKLAAARLVLTCTGYNVPNLQAMAQPLGIRRLRRIYHGTDLERFQFEPTGRSDPPLLLAVGRLVEKKGFRYLVAACALLRDRGVRCHCRIVAGARDCWDELSAQISELGLGELITVEGPCDQDEVREWYRQATLLAQPSIIADDGDRDGIPNVLVEAAASGLPIVSTTVSGIPELLRDGETGLAVPPRDAEALADAIERLLGSPELRASLAQGARAHVEELFDLRRNAIHVAHELRAAMASPAAGASSTLEVAGQHAS